MSSFKTLTGPGTIYERLLHPGADVPNPKPEEQEPESPSSKAASSNIPDVEIEEQTGLESNEDVPKAFSPASPDPRS